MHMCLSLLMKEQISPRLLPETGGIPARAGWACVSDEQEEAASVRAGACLPPKTAVGWWSVY